MIAIGSSSCKQGFCSTPFLPAPLSSWLPGFVFSLMSFNFHLVALTESARDRLSRLETQGSALRDRFLSPSSSVPPTPRGRGSFSSPGVEAAAGGLLASEELGATGESFVPVAVSGGGASPSRWVFKMTSDLQCTLFLGFVGNGLKFCTLGAEKCAFTTHTKKVRVDVGSLYIASVRNSAFLHYAIPSSLLSPTQLTTILKERFPRRSGHSSFIHGGIRQALTHATPQKTELMRSSR